ncbi:MAG TPA: tetratricopeptide repeat protein [Candidatus Eremiobacteraceae bacterium]|nr:tetratricopeptide repeat protein [Candidatus Eremiobacteraceae bacterium]
MIALIAFILAASITSATPAPVASAAAASPSPTPAPTATASASPGAPTAASLYAQAQLDAASGRNSAALDELQQATAMDPNDMDIVRLLGDVQYRLEHYTDAEATYKNVIAHEPNDRELHNKLGGVYVAEGRLDEAATQFRLSLPSQEGTIDLVQLYTDEGRLPELEAEDQLDLDRAPADDPVSRFELAYVLYAEKKYTESIEMYEQALDLKPSFWEARNGLGSDYGAVGRYQDAITQYKMGLELNPACYECWMNWGVELIAIDDDNGAIEKIQKSIQINPQFAIAYMNLGDAYDGLGDFQRAIELFQQALTYDPRAPEVFFNLGWEYYEHGMYSLAEAAYIKGLAIHPRDAQLHLALGYYYQNRQQYDQAIAEYKLAMEYDPTNDTAKQYLDQVEALVKKPSGGR